MNLNLKLKQTIRNRTYRQDAFDIKRPACFSFVPDGISFAGKTILSVLIC